MIQIHPQLDLTFTHPDDGAPLEVEGWTIPGMRNLARLRDQRDGRRYWADLPTSNAMYFPQMIDEEGTVYDRYGVAWFAEWLSAGFRNRTRRVRDFEVEVFYEVQHGVLVNCLDTVYGHSILRLLNAQWHIDKGHQVVVLVPKRLRWMVPEGVSEIWSIDLPYQEGVEWNDNLAELIAGRVANWETGHLSPTFAHVDNRKIELKRFVGVEPFAIESFGKQKPTVTYVWRDDRVWEPPVSKNAWPNLFRETSKKRPDPNAHLQSLHKGLQEALSELRFIVTGLGTPGGLPPEIEDRRSSDPTIETERIWCSLWAKSQFVLGTLGSHMLLASGLAGASVVFAPPDRWGNLYQDNLLSVSNPREALLRSLSLPHNTSEQVVIDVIVQLFRALPHQLRYTEYPGPDHALLAANPWAAVLER